MRNSERDYELLQNAFIAFGLRLDNYSRRFPYADRKGDVFCVVDDGVILCTYATLGDIKAWVRRRLLPKILNDRSRSPLPTRVFYSPEFIKTLVVMAILDKQSPIPFLSPFSLNLLLTLKKQTCEAQQ